jgi:flap endonuclease-1
MGIKGLSAAIRKFAPGAIKSQPFSSLRGKTLVVDGYNYLYAWWSVGSKIMPKVEGVVNVSAPLFIAANTIMRWIGGGVKLIFVLDGAPPDSKAATLAKRKDSKEKGSSPPQHFVEAVSAFLAGVGVPVYRAEFEADLAVALFVREGRADAVLSEDMDILAYGADLIRAGKTTSSITYYDYKAVLEGMRMNAVQFVDYCILLGCDYTGKLKGVGPVRAHTVMTQWPSIEAAQQAGAIPTSSDFVPELARVAFRAWAELPALEPVSVNAAAAIHALENAGVARAGARSGKLFAQLDAL